MRIDNTNVHNPTSIDDWFIILLFGFSIQLFALQWRQTCPVHVSLSYPAKIRAVPGPR